MNSWIPHPKQITALLANDFEIAYGGARFAGKSDLMRAWMMYPYKYSDYVGLVVRKNAISLKEWKQRARQMYRAAGARVVGFPPEVTFPSGAKIYTAHMAHEHSYENFQGWNIQRLGIEELQLIPQENQFEKMIAVCRSSNSDLPPQLMTNFNPGGPGHNWIKKRYKIEGKPPYKQIRTKYRKGDRTRLFIPGTIHDNITAMKADPEYYHTLESIRDEKTRDAWLFGDFTAFSGQYFKYFTPEAFKVKPYEIPPHWQMWAGLDYGEANHTAFGVYVLNEINGKVVRLLTYYEDNRLAEQHAQGIKEKCAEFPYARIDLSTLDISPTHLCG